MQAQTLFEIAQDLSRMQLIAAVDESDMGRVHEGDPVRFTVDAYPGDTFAGTVSQVRMNPNTDQNVVTYNVVVKVDNPDQILLPGMTAYVNIAVAKRKEVLLVPNAALRYKPTSAQKPAAAAPGTENANAPGASGASRGPGSGNGGSGGNGGGKSGDRPRKKDSSSGTVYVLRGGELVPVAITLGITDNRNTEVVGGELNPDDQVVTGENLPDTPAGTGTSTMRMRMF